MLQRQQLKRLENCAHRDDGRLAMNTLISNECCRAVEKFCLRALLISIGILLLWLFGIVIAVDQMVIIHGAMFGIEEVRMEQFTYDAKMLNYLLMGAFKLAAFLLFGIPWLILRFSSAFRVKSQTNPLHHLNAK